MMPINLKIENPIQKKILTYLIQDRIKLNSKEIRLNRDKLLNDYYSKQNNELEQLLNQLL